jgi:ABC-type multidrug transport system fused ATPase/permease subunit
VPQQIFPADDTITRNIAFRIEQAAVDNDAMAKAARKANLYEFGTGELTDGFDTIVGDRGIRLSG